MRLQVENGVVLYGEADDPEEMLEADEWYPKDLISLEARLAEGNTLGLAPGTVVGKVVDVIEVAQWLLKIRLANPVKDADGVVVENSALVPFVDELVPDIDLEFRQGQKRARLKPLDPTKAVYTLMLSKALGLTGAALAGWYVGQILLVLDHIEADYYATAVTQCAVAAVICLADMVIGIVGEWLCQLPPMEGPENPKMKAAKRRRGIASATAKTRH